MLVLPKPILLKTIHLVTILVAWGMMVTVNNVQCMKMLAVTMGIVEEPIAGLLFVSVPPV